MGRCVFPTQWGSTAACGGDGAADGGAERSPIRPRSESELQPLLQLIANGVHNVGDIVVNVASGEPNDSIAVGLEPGLAAHVIGIPAVVVARTVNLHDELRRGAVEVDVVLPDRLLPTELPSVEPSLPQANPDPELGSAHRCPQQSGRRGTRGGHPRKMAGVRQGDYPPC